MANNPVDRLTLKIILLSLVNDLPEQPNVISFSRYTGVQESPPGRTLALKHEISTTQQLAFICAYSDNPLHVLAVCVEEIPEDCLVIRFAANTGKHEALVVGLIAISRILQDEAKNVRRSTNHESLFQVVVALNRMRILSRIRSRHATSRRARNKPSLLQKLRTAIELLRDSSICSARTQSLAREVEMLQKKFNLLEDMDSLKARSSRSEEHLLDFIKSVHSFLLEYEQDLNLVPRTSGLWDENATYSLIDRLQKVSQYIKACEELLKAARRYNIFSNITVDFVDLQQGGRRLSADAASDIDNIINASCAKDTLLRISRHRGKSVSDTQASIKAQLDKTSRLHAEVQLVLYYEQGDRLLRPRVICSSKSACYLCHLLLKIHGQYLIPSSHGRLYGTWKWPRPTELPNQTVCSGVNIDLQRLLPEFSDAIDRKVQECLHNAKIMKRAHPLESRVDLLAAITPSILSRHTSSTRSGVKPQHEFEENIKTIHTNDNVADYKLSQPSPKRIMSPTVNSEDSVSCGGTATPTMNNYAFGSSFRDNSMLDKTSHGRNQGCELHRRVFCLRKGESASYSFDMQNILLQVHAPGLQVDLQYDASRVQGSRLKRRAALSLGESLQIEVECFPPILGSDYSIAQVVDLDDTWVEKAAPEGVLFSPEGLLLKKRSTLLRFRVLMAAESLPTAA